MTKFIKDLTFRLEAAISFLKDWPQLASEWCATQLGRCQTGCRQKSPDREGFGVPIPSIGPDCREPLRRNLGRSILLFRQYLHDEVLERPARGVNEFFVQLLFCHLHGIFLRAARPLFASDSRGICGSQHPSNPSLSGQARTIGHVGGSAGRRARSCEHWDRWADSRRNPPFGAGMAPASARVGQSTSADSHGFGSHRTCGRGVS